MNRSLPAINTMKVSPRVLKMLLWSILLVCSSSCTTPWPNLPPTTYQGQVVHNELKTGVANATITASRPCVRSSLWPMIRPEVLATVKSDAHGRFSMTTLTGYATQIETRSSDEKLIGSVNPSRKHTNPIELNVSAELRGISYQPYVDPESPASRTAASAIRRLVRHISSHPYHPLRSLRWYSKEGVISAEELLVFESAPEHYFGPHSLVEYQWGRQALLIPNQNTAIRLVRQRTNW